MHFSRVLSISLFGNWKDGEIGDKRKGKKSVGLVLSCRRWSGNIYIIFFCRAILFLDLLCFWPQFSCYSDFWHGKLWVIERNWESIWKWLEKSLLWPKKKKNHGPKHLICRNKTNYIIFARVASGGIINPPFLLYYELWQN